jgi:hypothetical protein
MGMDTRRVWVWAKIYTHGYGYGQNYVPIDYTGMGMVLLYPAHTLPIAILMLHWLSLFALVHILFLSGT